MKQTTMKDNTVYEIVGGNTLYKGTGYSIKAGKTLIKGTEHNIEFPTIVSIYDDHGPQMFMPTTAGVIIGEEAYYGTFLSPEFWEIRVEPGTQIICCAKGYEGTSAANEGKGLIFLNDKVVAEETGGRTTARYVYEVKESVTIRLEKYETYSAAVRIIEQ